MNRNFLILLVAMVCIFSACSNGDYSANPSSNASGSINPLNPLTSSQFTWSGSTPMSGNINGGGWTADNATFVLDTNGTNILVGIKGNQIMTFYLNNVWGGNLYNMGYKVTNRFGVWIDSTDGPYYSYLGNSGEVKIIENDSAVVEGQFYFQGASTAGKIVNITNGYFKINKF